MRLIGTKRFHSLKVQPPFLRKELDENWKTPSFCCRGRATSRLTLEGFQTVLARPSLQIDVFFHALLKAGISRLFASCLSSLIFMRRSQSGVGQFKTNEYPDRQDTLDVALVTRRCSLESLRPCLSMVLTAKKARTCQGHRVIAGNRWLTRGAEPATLL